MAFSPKEKAELFAAVYGVKPRNISTPEGRAAQAAFELRMEQLLDSWAEDYPELKTPTNADMDFAARWGPNGQNIPREKKTRAADLIVGIGKKPDED